jgi:hypothetical protein
MCTVAWIFTCVRRLPVWLVLVVALWCTVIAAAPAAAQDHSLPPPTTPPTSAEQHLPDDGWRKLPPITPEEWGAGAQHGVASAGTTEFSSPSWVCMVFDSLRDGNWEVYAINGGDPTPRRLTRSAEPDVDASVNRGCTAVAYVGYQGKDQIATIFRMGIDGSGNTALTRATTPTTIPSGRPTARRLSLHPCVQATATSLSWMPMAATYGV